MPNISAGFKHNQLSKEMKKTIKFSLAASAVVILAACGGGGGGATAQFYGALAMGKTYGIGISTGQFSQADANTLALNRCGSDCRIIEPIPANKCVASSYSTSPGLRSYAIADSLTAAKSQSEINCAKSGGTYCTTDRSACNN